MAQKKSVSSNMKRRYAGRLKQQSALSSQICTNYVSNNFVNEHA